MEKTILLFPATVLPVSGSRSLISDFHLKTKDTPKAYNKCNTLYLINNIEEQNLYKMGCDYPPQLQLLEKKIFVFGSSC